MILGHIVGIHIEDEMIEDGRVDVTRYQPVARLGYKDYTDVAELYEMTP